ncbi:hypothetical protein CYMTET_4223 [Cymbomonas tetramitiformis]|uniref:Methyltransferase type 11 domain-containing protein n=1 Tax=Cymbomonas tetramitiformis TaxID=36881 RepID=A0AAE0LKR4_9CHLO|nr:hypothetical protein CYMTET_4223 [Cymbomonas tetramitiformis]
MLRALGKNAYGVELSEIALKQDAKDLLNENWVRQGSLRKLPYADNQFDAVLSADVLEHLTPDIADAVVSELVRHVWLVGLAAQQNVRDFRYITLANGEIEPWYFVFRKVRNASNALLDGKVH